MEKVMTIILEYPVLAIFINLFLLALAGCALLNAFFDYGAWKLVRKTELSREKKAAELKGGEIKEILGNDV